jgi:hypothetical protein
MAGIHSENLVRRAVLSELVSAPFSRGNAIFTGKWSQSAYKTQLAAYKFLKFREFLDVSRC